jgi:adenine-specific DNA-methyltransferase
MIKPAFETPDRTQSNIEKIGELFPSVITEAADDEKSTSDVKVYKKVVNFEALKQLLTDEALGGNEAYEFTWVGKKASIVEANKPIRKTLRPCKEESRDWETTQNLYVEGDNLEVLKLLQESYLGKVKMICIDPPYNTGNDFVYRDDFSIDTDDYLEESGEVSEDDAKLVANPRTYARFHSAWLTMMHSRLLLARNLLCKDGVIVVAIDENEQAALAMLLGEIFGGGGYEIVCVSVVHNPRGVQGINFSYTHEYAIFVFPMGKKMIMDRKIAEEDVDWSQLRNWGGESERTDAKNCFYPIIVENGQVVRFGDVSPDSYHPAQTEWNVKTAYVYPVDRNGIERKWRYARQSVEAIASMLRARKTAQGYEIETGKTFGTYKTVWTDKRYDANEYGSKIINQLCPDCGFSFPKSLYTGLHTSGCRSGQRLNRPRLFLWFRHHRPCRYAA